MKKCSLSRQSNLTVLPRTFFNVSFNTHISRSKHFPLHFFLKFYLHILGLSNNFYNYSYLILLHKELFGQNKINLPESLVPKAHSCFGLSRVFLIRKFCVNEQMLIFNFYDCIANNFIVSKACAVFAYQCCIVELLGSLVG